MGMLLECASLEAWWKRSAVPYTIPLFSFLLIFSRFFLYFAKTRELVELREWTAIVIFLFMCFAPDHKMTWTSYCQKQELVVMFFWPLRSVHNKHQQIQAWTDKVRSHCPDGEFGSSAWVVVYTNLSEVISEERNFCRCDRFVEKPINWCLPF
jgi:hypothetical protein